MENYYIKYKLQGRLACMHRGCMPLSLEEVEAFRRSLKVCPKCGLSEGFWLTAKRDRSYVQCKHCGAIIELCEVFSVEGAAKKDAQSRRGILRRELRV